MVYLWYPADVLAGAPRANYLPDFAGFECSIGEAAMKKLLGGAGSMAARTGRLKPHAIQNAKLSSSKKQYPLLVFSPGFDRIGPDLYRDARRPCEPRLCHRRD